MRTSPPLAVDARDAETLREWVASNSAASTIGRRARIVLLSGAGNGPSAIAAELGCSKQTVITWRERYRSDGIGGLRDAPRSGRPATVDPELVIGRTLDGPPEELGAVRWSTRLLAAELGISNVAVANVWRGWGVAPMPAGRVRLGTEPGLDLPVTALAGMYLDSAGKVLVVEVGTGVRREGPVVPAQLRADLGPGLDGIDPGPEPDAAGLDSFLRATARAAGPRSAQVALIVGVGAGGRPLPEPLRDPGGATVHVVPPALSWGRLARVACLVAAASPAGAEPVLQLRRAVAGHVPGGPFSWTADVAATCVQ